MSSVVAVSPAVEVMWVSVADLELRPSLREGGVCEEHVERLVALRGHWSPILVDRGDGSVIDGVHRVVAARRLGMDRVEASLFDGGPDEALMEFVRRNVHHGLPLTLRERKRAARRVLVGHPEWSDRRVAELCAISPKTVGRLRDRGVEPGEHPTEDNPHLDSPKRVGLDNKSRPVNSASVRSRVVQAINNDPGASLRAVAAIVGVSPETVRLVRMNMTSTAVGVEPSRVAVDPPVPAPPVDAGWEHDDALKTCDQGEFVGWFERTALDESDWQRWIDTVPVSRVYQVADEARRRSATWTQFARALESRLGRRN